MDFIVKECSFLAFFCLSLGAFGDVVEPFIENRVALAGDPLLQPFSCNSSLSPMNFTWSMWPVGGQRMRAIASGDLVVDNETFRASVEYVGFGNQSYLKIHISNASTAGVYTCDEGQKQSAQFIVITEESECNINPKPNEKRSSDKISQLSCTMKYAANESYVVANVIWSIYGSSESLKSHMEKSTSANITTATATLNITMSENLKCVSIYICTTTFSLTNNLPSGFAKKEPEYARACSPNADGCETYQPACNFAPEPNETRPRNEISHLSCTVKYVANSYYVLSNMKWSVDGSSESLKSSMENSTSANITTATSTLNRTSFEKHRCASVYRCTTTFSMTYKLPIGLSWDRPRPSYARACSLNVPNGAACDTYKPVCNFAPEPNEARSSDEISQLSCTLKYAANESYVVTDMKWTIAGLQETLNSSMQTSTSANITTATSTLNLARCASSYICTTTFSLREELPIVFSWNKPSFVTDCFQRVPNSAACKDEEPTEPSRKPPGANWVEKSDGNSDKSGVTPGKNAGGLSVGSSKRNIVIKCIVGIAGFLLIGIGTGV